MINKTLAFVAVGAAMLTACSEKDSSPVQKQDGKFSYLFQVGNADSQQGTKATIGNTAIEWASTDKIGVYASTSVNQSSVITTGTPCTINVTSSVALTSGDKVYCYFPYSADNASNAVNAIKMSIPYYQTNMDASTAPMVGLPYTMSSDAAASTQTAVGRINFCNLAGGFLFRIYSSNSSYTSEKVKRVVFNANEAIAGDFTFDLTAVKYSDPSTLAISGYSIKRIATSVADLTPSDSKTTTIANVSMLVAPGSYTGTVQVFTDKAIYTYNVTTAKTVERNTIKTLDVDLGSAALRSYVDAAVPTYTSKNIHGLSWLTDGRLAVSNRTTHNIVALDLTAGTYKEIAKAYAKHPWMHKVNPDDGLLYVAYKYSGEVATVDPSKDEAPKVILTGLTNAMDVDFDASGNLYVLCRDLATIYKYPKGNFTNSAKTVFATFKTTDNKNYQIFAMEFDKNGNLLVTKGLNGYIGGIDMVTTDGTITHIIGGNWYEGTDIAIGDGIPGQPLTARFKQIASITLDSKGNIYLLDDGNKYIKMIQLGSHGYTDATVETVGGNNMVGTLAAGNGDLKVNSDDSKLYFTTPDGTARPVYVINLK